MLDIKTSILKKNSNIDNSILNKLIELTNKYNLKWIPSAVNNDGAFFIMSDLSIAKGLDSEDYIKNWISLTTSSKKVSSEPLAGNGLKLEGSSLKNFKDKYKEIYDKSLGRINSLWVGDFLHAYSYLVQGTTNAAKDFQDIGAKSIESQVKDDIKQIQEPTQSKNIVTEMSLQQGIMQLVSYSNIKFTFEVGVKNTFPSNDNAGHRRFDWVEVLPKIVKIYELKNKAVTDFDIKDKLNKHYIELAATNYPNKFINFIFTSLNGITWEGKDYINELMNNDNKYISLYTGIQCKILFIDLQEITERIINNIKLNRPIECNAWLIGVLKSNSVNQVISNRSINKLLNNKNNNIV